jgi:hypothetical protein
MRLIILATGNNPFRSETGLPFTGWYGINRLHAEGPYESITSSDSKEKYVPTDGPLARTESDTPGIWVALTEGHICVTPKTDDFPPPSYLEGMVVRGYYDVDSGKMNWHAIGPVWDENEIAEFRELSNPAYQLYKKVPAHPEHIFLFGAGASFGSDGSHMYKQGLLPPLGNDLYPHLRDAPELKYWKDIPPEVLEMFLTRPFEEAMSALDKCEGGATKALWRDIELSLFFSRYRPADSNLYWKLASKIAKRLKTMGWSGAAITLNYERLLEESFIRNMIFTTVKGVTFYDDHLPRLQDGQLFEICYPHGACQFFFPQTWFAGEGDIVFGDTASIQANVGTKHLLKRTNIPKACELRQIPLICRYHPTKRASVNNYFITTQKERSQELIANATIVTIVGVQCFYQTDTHLWEPLAKTHARIVYVEPGLSGQEQFKTWALGCGKQEGQDFIIIPKTFKDSFDTILKVNEL